MPRFTKLWSSRMKPEQRRQFSKMSLEGILRRVLQRNRPEQEIYTDIYYYRLAHMTLEAEQFSIWSPREVGGIIQSKSECLRTREADKVNPSPQREEMK